MAGLGMKVGEVSRQTGLTVRTLHHYDSLGLLSPSGRTAAGHRLYTDHDLARLQQIVSLRQLGFSLEQIGQMLRQPGCSLQKTMTLHLEAVRARLERTRKLCRQLEKMAALLQAGEVPSLEILLKTIEVTTMQERQEKYFTDEQLAKLKALHRQHGPEWHRQQDAAWRQLFSGLKSALDGGAPPTSREVQALAEQCDELVRNLTGGDADLRHGLEGLFRGEPAAVEAYLPPGADRKLFEYLGQARKALKKQSPNVREG